MEQTADVVHSNSDREAFRMKQDLVGLGKREKCVSEGILASDSWWR